MQWLKSAIRTCLEWLESGLDRVCGPDLNPLTQLGALGWFQFWLIAASDHHHRLVVGRGLLELRRHTDQRRLIAVEILDRSHASGRT